ncbi:MAG TPA: lipoyl synthase [Candidatus Cloacimonadota bacterium]|nr:lipoyl synthase [Candidatus Cloacimonadota bacterium]HPT72956.1 lipoyl synthase [Candidatus Cloacimonadota bacterium]
MSEVRKPSWLKANKLGSKRTNEIIQQLRHYHLHTVCQSAQCPNKGECFDNGTATFLLLGDVCTRNCLFCAIDKNRQVSNPDPNEPEAIGRMSHDLKLKHIVLTMVSRDDISDGGASHIVEVIQHIREYCGHDITIEVLISDLQGNKEALHSILDAKPDILNHNVETVPRLYSAVRPQADYQRSLGVISETRNYAPELMTKSGIMVGLGETKDEVLQVMRDLHAHGCDLLTIGQYLAPTKKHYPVAEYIHPDIFTYYHDEGKKMGFMHVESGPLVRSSYHAEKARIYMKSS